LVEAEPRNDPCKDHSRRDNDYEIYDDYEKENGGARLEDTRDGSEVESFS